MPLDENRIRRLSAENEERTEELFRRMGFTVQRLDHQGTRARPEFLISDAQGAVLVCEVKTVTSLEYLRNRGVHASSEDESFVRGGPFALNLDFRKIDRLLADAVRKYQALLMDRADMRGLPMVVTLFFDPVPECYDLIPMPMPEFPEVSGLLKVETNRQHREAVQALSAEELAWRIERRCVDGLPGQSSEFRLLENTCAEVRLPASFTRLCARTFPNEDLFDKS